MSLNEETLLSLYESMVEWRRHLHRNPELSFQENETSRFIADKLEAWGYEVVRGIAGTGVLGRLRGGLPGRTIALRADIDALPIQDEKSCEYASAVPDVMHACGHDGHTAELLGVARYYSLHKNETRGDRVLLFQPAEEVLPGGALRMIAEGALSGVSAIYGVHLWSSFPYGIATTRPGAFMASPDEFEVELVGRGGHGGLPHQSRDALLAGAHLVTALQTVVARNVNPVDSAVLTVGRLQSGTGNNIIADKCKLGGTIRTFAPEVRALMKQRLEEVVRHTAALHGVEARVQFFEGYPPVVNDEREAARVLNIAANRLGSDRARPCEPIMAGEDFSYYLQERPGCFIFIGAGREDGSSPPHHHPRFDIDERAMLIAAGLLIAVADDAAADDEPAAGA